MDCLFIAVWDTGTREQIATHRYKQPTHIHTTHTQQQQHTYTHTHLQLEGPTEPIPEAPKTTLERCTNSPQMELCEPQTYI